MQIDRVGAHQYSTLAVRDDDYEGDIIIIAMRAIGQGWGVWIQGRCEESKKVSLVVD